MNFNHLVCTKNATRDEDSIAVGGKTVREERNV